MLNQYREFPTTPIELDPSFDLVIAFSSSRDIQKRYEIHLHCTLTDQGVILDADASPKINIDWSDCEDGEFYFQITKDDFGADATRFGFRVGATHLFWQIRNFEDFNAKFIHQFLQKRFTADAQKIIKQAFVACSFFGLLINSETLPNVLSSLKHNMVLISWPPQIIYLLDSTKVPPSSSLDSLPITQANSAKTELTTTPLHITHPLQENSNILPFQVEVTFNVWQDSYATAHGIKLFGIINKNNLRLSFLNSTSLADTIRNQNQLQSSIAALKNNKHCIFDILYTHQPVTMAMYSDRNYLLLRENYLTWNIQTLQDWKAVNVSCLPVQAHEKCHLISLVRQKLLELQLNKINELKIFLEKLAQSPQLAIDITFQPETKQVIETPPNAQLEKNGTDSLYPAPSSHPKPDGKATIAPPVTKNNSAWIKLFITLSIIGLASFLLMLCAILSLSAPFFPAVILALPFALKLGVLIGSGITVMMSFILFTIACVKAHNFAHSQNHSSTRTNDVTPSYALLSSASDATKNIKENNQDPNSNCCDCFSLLWQTSDDLIDAEVDKSGLKKTATTLSQ